MQLTFVFRLDAVLLRSASSPSSAPSASLAWKLCFPPGDLETEFRRQVRSQTEFGNEEREIARQEAFL
jgi:hypothetical protein